MKTSHSSSDMTIGQAAKRAGVGIETIRFYQRRGLIQQPPPRYSGYRRYSPEIVTRICFVRRAKELGFSLKEIADLLGLQIDQKATCGDVKQRAEEKITTIDARVHDLQKMKRSLVRLTVACSGQGSLDDCPILDCFEAGTNNARPSKRRVRTGSGATAKKGR